MDGGAAGGGFGRGGEEFQPEPLCGDPLGQCSASMKSCWALRNRGCDKEALRMWQVSV